ncbi:MAG: hypothetical protein IJ122_05900 [Methanobrevibacter sp.]|nr:hypothetical protein [Methanobrevibacter sp.]
MTKYRIVKRSYFWKPYSIQISENKKRYEDFTRSFTENGIRKKWYEMFSTSYDDLIKEIE